MMTTTRAGLLGMALVVALAGSVRAQEWVVEDGAQIASRLEAIALTLHDHADRWADAAILYRAAADLRPSDDHQAQKDLFTAAQLYVETEHVGDAIAALEVAGSRALASGDGVLARDRFADAAWVAQRAGLSRELQRLSYRAAEVAMSNGLEQVAGSGRLADAEASLR